MRILPLVLLLALPLFGAGSTAAAAQTATVELRGYSYAVETAEDDASRARGLMFRSRMPVDHGMLFIFQDDAPRAFWMKNTLISLDMLFFDAERRLLSVQHDVPPCRADPCAGYPSGAPARYVLELNAGQARVIGATPGDVLEIRR